MVHGAKHFMREPLLDSPLKHRRNVVNQTLVSGLVELLEQSADFEWIVPGVLHKGEELLNHGELKHGRRCLPNVALEEGNAALVRVENAVGKLIEV